MRRVLVPDALKVCCYLVATLLLGSLLAPWLYNAGKALAEVTQGKQTNGAIAWFAAACRRAQYGRYFDRAILISALSLMWPLIRWLRAGRGELRFRDTPWSLRLPDEKVVLHEGQPLQRNPRGLREFTFGACASAVLLFGMGLVLVQAGAFEWRAPSHLGKLLLASAWSALVVAALEEVLFRGVLLGMFLRALRPWPAMISLSLLFAFVHFLEPERRAVSADPEAWHSGLCWLGNILARFLQPLHLLDAFATLAVAGFVLAYARWRTASLWLPLGLHAGWIFSITLFKELTVVVRASKAAWSFWIGSTLREGVAPLVMLAVTGVLVYVFTRRDVRTAS